MHVRCSYCSNSFNLTREYVAQIVAEAEEKGQKYSGVECTKCRKQIKVPLDQMRKHLPEEGEES